MVKRLLGFVLLIGVVALLLQWMSLRESEPEPEKDVEVQVAVVPEDPPKEAPAPDPEPSTPPAAEQPSLTPPAPAEEASASAAAEQAPESSPAAEEPPEESEPEPFSAPSGEQSPAEPAAAEREDTSPESEAPAPAATEQESPAPPATEEETPPPEPEPSAPPYAEQTPPTPPADEPVSPAESEPLPPSAGEQAAAQSATEEERSPAEAPESPSPAASAVPSEPTPPEEAVVEERVIPDEEFVAVEQAQGRTDERTDAQRRHQNQDGWYGWGVLADYADPDGAARLLGGAAVVQREGSFFTLRESTGGRVTARPIANVSAAYGSIALRGHGSVFRQRLRSALSTGQLLGREADYKLWYLFPRREATHLGNKVVAVFECHARESGLSGAAAERFRKESKLRGAVLALRRANGGRLGIYLPRYFQNGEGRVPVAEPCRTLDEESRRFGS